MTERRVQSASDIPHILWKKVCESVEYPLACVDLRSYFLWANAAFEKLLGYSETELKDLNRYDITVSQDVEGDKKAAENLLKGVDEKYTRSKRYRHKRGHEVEVDVIVWRFPLTGDPIMLIIEATPKSTTKKEFEERCGQLEALIVDLNEKFETAIRTREERKSMTGNIFNVGNQTNDTTVHKWLVFGLVALISGITYVVWIMDWDKHQGNAPPPQSPPLVTPDE